jgi:hypothetical protein
MRDRRGTAGTSAGRSGQASFDMPIRSAWSFSGLRVVLFGALVPILLVAAAVVWAVSRPIDDAPKVASAAALDCTSSRDAWRWACQQDKLGEAAQDPAIAKHDAITTGSVEPARRRAAAAKTAAASPAPAKVAAVEPKPAPAADAPPKAGAKPAPAAKVAAVEAKPAPEVPAAKADAVPDVTKPIEPAPAAKAAEPAPKQAVAAAPVAPVPPAPAKRDDVAVAPPPAAPAPQQAAWIDPAPKADAPKADAPKPESTAQAPGSTAAVPPAPEPKVAAMPPDETDTTGSVTPLHEQRRGSAAKNAVPAPIPTREAAAEAAVPEPRAGARPAPKAEKPARVARHRPAARREAVAEREETAVVPRAPASMRLRAARAVMPRQAGGVVPALRVTSTETYVLPDGRRVTMNVAPSSDVVRQLVQEHTRAYQSPRASRPYWDW